MDAEERALLAAIVAHPDEDTPRLVYADWLQEHDRPERAEYIRLSIQLANLRYGDPNCEADGRRIREQRRPLVERFIKQWHQEFAARCPANRDLWFGFRRGFVESAHCSVTYFLTNADLLFREAPLRWFSPKSLTAITTANLTASRSYGKLRGIRIIGADDARTLLESPLQNIREFDFSQEFMRGGRTEHGTEWEPVAVRLAEHPNLGSLRWINLEACGIGDAGGEALANSPRLNLEALNLLGNELSEEVRRALRERYGSRVWLEPADRNGFPRWR